jgi:hypothetical protein
MHMARASSSTITPSLALVAAVTLSCPSVAWAQRDSSLPDPGGDVARLVEIYRTDPTDRALDELDRFVTSKEARTAAERWFGRRARSNAGERAKLEAGLMMYSEALMRIWAGNEFHPDGPAARYIPTVTFLHDRLQDLGSRSAFLRGWYLLWEAFKQIYVDRPLPHTLDFLDDALRAFRDDGEIQLAAGARHELQWWTAVDNPRRDPRGSWADTTRAIGAARDHFRRAVALDARDGEARLRLMRISLELNDLGGAEQAFAGHDWSAESPPIRYLARLFEGALRERQNDPAGAARAYDLAIATAAQAQSARIAKAHLQDTSSSRSEAAAAVIATMSVETTENDPWWVYGRGLAWRFDAYIKKMRAMVRQ